MGRLDAYCQPNRPPPHRAVGGMGSYPKGYDGDAESPLGCAGFQTQKTPISLNAILSAFRLMGVFLYN